MLVCYNYITIKEFNFLEVEMLNNTVQQKRQFLIFFRQALYAV